MKRGLALPLVHSALATTRRGRLQLSRVDQSKSLKQRAGLSAARLLGAGLDQLALDLCDEPPVAGESEDVFDAVFLAPAHQVVAAEAGVGPEHDAHAGPAGADLRDDALDLLDARRRGVDVGAPELGGEQMPAAEDVQRQVAVAVVVAVEEAALLVAMQRDRRWHRGRARSASAGADAPPGTASTNSASIASVSCPIL